MWKNKGESGFAFYGSYENDSLHSTGIQPASCNEWILPRPNQVSTGHLIAPVCALVSAFQVLSCAPANKKTTPEGVVFVGSMSIVGVEQKIE